MNNATINHLQVLVFNAKGVKERLIDCHTHTLCVSCDWTAV